MADQGPTGPLPLAEIIQYGGMAIGAGLAALLVRLGWKKLPTPETEVAIAGQATIVDTGPIKEMLKQVDLLTLQLQKATFAVDAQNALHARTAAALEALALAMAAYLKEQAERQEKLELEALVRAELRREMEAHGEEPATQPTRKR
jgi:hypothetical protein